MTRQFNKQTQDELSTVSFSYIVLVTRADNSRSCYGPMTMNQAILAKTQMERWNNGATVEIIYLTMVAPKT